MTRCRRASGIVGELSTSKVASTLVFDRLACWPPGPPEGVNRSEISCSGTVQVTAQF